MGERVTEFTKKVLMFISVLCQKKTTKNFEGNRSTLANLNLHANRLGRESLMPGVQWECALNSST